MKYFPFEGFIGKAPSPLRLQPARDEIAMWEKLVELFVKKGLDLLPLNKSPRKKLARAFVTLFDRLNKCHEAYLLSRHDLDSYREEWMKSILALSISIDELRVLLDVHNKALKKELEEYLASEMQVSFNNDPMVLHELEEAVRFSKAIYDRQGKEEVFNKEWDQLSNRLKTYMREELKLSPEEILDV